MKQRAIISCLLVAACGGLIAAAPGSGPEPGLVFVHTVRIATILTPAGSPRALKRGESFSASGQTLTAPAGQTLALVFSNGDTALLPDGGKLILEEFTQESVDNTSKDRDYEPSRSTLRLNFTQGTLVLAGRRLLPTSTTVLTTPLAQLNCRSNSLVVRVDNNTLTVTLFEGTADLTVTETGFHDTVQAGQTITLNRQTLRDAYPLKLARNTADQENHLGAWLAMARWTENRVDFSRVNGKLSARLVVPVEFTQQGSIDDPRFR